MYQPAKDLSFKPKEQPNKQRKKYPKKQKYGILTCISFFLHFFADICRFLHFKTQPAIESSLKPKKQLETSLTKTMRKIRQFAYSCLHCFKKLIIQN
jgi:hypothetical protein